MISKKQHKESQSLSGDVRYARGLEVWFSKTRTLQLEAREGLQRYPCKAPEGPINMMPQHRRFAKRTLVFLYKILLISA